MPHEAPDEAPDQAARRKPPRFHSAVVSSFGGGDAPAPAFAAHLASLPVCQIGQVVECFTAGSNCMPVDRQWSARVLHGGRLGAAASVVRGSPSGGAPAASHAPAPQGRRIPAPPPQADGDSCGEDGEMADALAVDASRRAAAGHPGRLGVGAVNRSTVASSRCLVRPCCARAGCVLLPLLVRERRSCPQS